MSKGEQSKTEADRDERINQAIVEFLRAQEAGVQNEIEKLRTKYADVADELNDFILQNGQFDSFVSPIQKLKPKLAPSLDDTVPNFIQKKEFGDYELIEEIGRGGMGVIVHARQPSLKRDVAIKMILDARFASDTDLQRFQAEAEAAAALNHRNIVPIYEVGKHEGQQYFTMALIHGGSLKDRLAEIGGLHPKEAAQLTLEIAQAVHFAHQHGILHRDLKPGNILLDDKSTRKIEFDSRSGDNLPYVPMVTDFGLAKHLGSDGTLTHTHAVLGTPSYMAPEQAEGSSKNVTTATDVYGLGAVLYAALTGRAPFESMTPHRTIQQVIKEIPVSPRKSNSAVDRDLETICLKCLEKNPAERYLSAADLVADLQRFLEGEPILARRSSTFERSWKWAKRKPMAASLLGVSILAIVGAFVGMSIANYMISLEQVRKTDALNNVNKLLKEKVEQEKVIKATLAESLKKQAEALRRSGQQGQRAKSLEALTRVKSLYHEIDATPLDHEELLSEAIACISLPIDLVVERTWVHEKVEPIDGDAIAFDGDLEWVAFAKPDRTIAVTNIESGEEKVTLPIWRDHDTPSNFRMSPDGRFLAVIHACRCVDVWDLESGSRPTKPLITIRNSNWYGFNFDCASRTFACAHFKKDENDSEIPTITLVDLHNRKLSNIDAPGRINFLEFDPSNRRLAVTGQNFGVHILDVDTGDSLQHLPDAGFGGISWSPDGQTVAVSDVYKGINVFNASSGERIAKMQGSDVRQVWTGFLGQGRFLVANSWDMTSQIWDVRSGRKLLSASGNFIRVSEDGTRIGFVGNAEAGVWKVDGGSDALAHRGHGLDGDTNVSRVAVDSKLGLIATGGEDGCRIWHPNSTKQMAYLPIGQIKALEFLPRDGSLITSGQPSGLLRWPVKLNQSELTIGVPQQIGLPRKTFAETMAVSADGSVFVAEFHNSVFVFDTSDLSKFKHRLQYPGLQFTSVNYDGSLVATGNWKMRAPHAVAKIWSTESGEVVHTIATNYSTKMTFLTPSRALLQTNNMLQFLDTTTWQPVSETSDIASGSINNAPTEPFLIDEKHVATIDPQRDIAILDINTARKTSTLKMTANSSNPERMRISPDGSKIVCTINRQGFLVWNLELIATELKQLGFEWPNRPISDPGNDRLENCTAKIILDDPIEPTGEFSSIDFQPMTNQRLSNSLALFGQDSKQDMRTLVDLENTPLDVCGVPFNIGESMIYLSNPEPQDKAAVATLTDVNSLVQKLIARPISRQSIKDIGIDAKVNRLHFLMGCAWCNSVENGNEIAQIRVRFKDGAFDTFSLRRQHHLFDWQNMHGLHSPSRARLGWIGIRSDDDVLVGTSLVTWENEQHRDETVRSVDFLLTTDQNAKPFCLAITAETRKALHEPPINTD